MYIEYMIFILTQVLKDKQYEQREIFIQKEGGLIRLNENRLMKQVSRID